eukprot:6479104-Amphidinium_carterae.1
MLDSDLRHAKTADDLFLRQSDSAQRAGTGNWKVWLPRAMLRAAFQFLSVGCRSYAAMTRSSHKMVADVRKALAQVLHVKQCEHMERWFGTPATHAW